MISAEARPLGLRTARVAHRALGRARLGRPALAAALVTALVLGNLALRARMTDRGYVLSQLEQTLAALQVEHDRLELEVAHLESLERVEQVARLELGMTDPAGTGIVVIAPGERESAQGSPARDMVAKGAGDRLARIEKGVMARAGDALVGLVSPFVARWFYDIPDSEHPRIRLS